MDATYFILRDADRFLIDQYRDFVTLRSCMGLYPWYDALLAKGGHFYAAVDDRGILGAMVSTMPTENGVRADFFSLYCRATDSRPCKF